MIRIAVCAPSAPILSEDADRARALVAAEFPEVELHVHPQCFFVEGHFAGSDAQRLDALVECANDPSFDAVWFARGGYGACRIAEDAIRRFDRAARGKTWLGYSDAGYLLGALYRERIGHPVHAPMLACLRREGGDEAARRVLRYVSGDRSGVEPSAGERPTVAFNLMTLAMLCGTPLMPGLAGHVVMVEEVSEHLYAVDRLFFHVTAHLGGVAGLRLGRVSDVPVNDREFGMSAEEIARHWCERHAIAFLGSADIGHDAANRIVPFGLAPRPQPQ
ncbi:muramoyltetrapeptide carboxypeptidase [Novosphingobium chloroacetimidivorans]|uniref:Muramoyltetrapeptide carboxypeptidase n=1 Tax=Novosphingobium chloroacetimidivorans TaxID=1428314 RepID=A0A7W7NXF6_9SPHN|nr:LD-carboxypeptidase [Novosphingobium chloroacetimidivorans]MBB4859145.1 muramoyltetrapeptide carboxypeptidase [Novosphingobium chloroacetimidivorans]